MSKETTKRSDRQKGTDANRDPITGTPVGTGVVVAGPVARGRAGKEAAEDINSAAEDALLGNQLIEARSRGSERPLQQQTGNG